MDRSLAPLSDRQFGRAQARHLLRRTAFGGSAAEVDRLAALGPQGAAEAVLAQLDGDDDWPPPDVDADVIAPPDPEQQRQFLQARRDNDEQALRRIQQMRNRARREDQSMVEHLRQWWLQRLAGSSTPLRENLVLLWHGHFATRHRDVRDAYLLYRQNELFRAHPTRFDALARAIVRDPAMLTFLNNNRNIRRKPNENLARELMELFTLGVGNYSEDDIRAGARALTGYHVQDNDFVFRRNQHDDGEKTILGRSDRFDGDRFVAWLLEQPSCPRFVALQLYDHFVLDVADRPEAAPPVSRVVIDRLGALIERHAYDLRPVLAQLLASRHFHDPAVVGRKVKSPAHLICGAVRTLGVPPRDPALLSESMRLMGQVLFDPPSVAGWDGGPAWINTATLFARQNTTAYLLTHRSPRQRRRREDDDYDPAPLLESLDSREPAAIADHLVNLLIGEHVPAARREPLVNFLREHGHDRDALVEVLLLITAMPEYQLC